MNLLGWKSITVVAKIVGENKVQTIDDLRPKAVFIAPHQGMCITPQNLKVTIHWVGPKAVHYFIENRSQLCETSIDRFLSIINRKR